jgi:mannose-6-phosphate isomerase-like protein (cupin superfamily)
VLENGISVREGDPYTPIAAGTLAVLWVDRAEAVWFVWSGAAVLIAGGPELSLAARSAAFIPAQEAQTVTNRGLSVVRLIRCEARPQ